MAGRILLVFILFFSISSFALELGSERTPSDNAEYFAEFYSYDGLLRTARQSHSFARFFKKEDGKVVEVTDISWLPAPGNFGRRNKLPLLATTQGANYSLEQTMAIAGGKPITSHGQYPISPDLYRAAVLRKAELEAGSYSYKLFNGSNRGALNCIEALSGVIGHLRTGLRRGFGATSSIVSFFLTSGQMGSEWNSKLSSPATQEEPKLAKDLNPAPVVTPPAPAPSPSFAPEPATTVEIPQTNTHAVISTSPIIERPVRRPILQRLLRR